MNDKLYFLIYKDIMFNVCATQSEAEINKFNFINDQNLIEDDVKIMRISNIKELMEEVVE